MTSEWYVYVVRTVWGHLYTGITKDPQRRVHEHNHTNRGSKILRSQRPVFLTWCSDSPLTRSRALAFERKIKALKRDDKERFLLGDLSLEME